MKLIFELGVEGRGMTEARYSHKSNTITAPSVP